MDTDQHIYRSFLLRLWRAKDAEDSNWYASLEDPVTGKRKGFSDLDELVAYFQREFVEETDLPASDYSR